MTHPTTQVAIVGGGPVGLVLALFLDFHGVKTTLFNTEPAERWHPKGNGQNARTMEHYRRLGFSDEIRRLGLPGDHPFDQAYFTRLSAHEIYRFPMPSRDEISLFDIPSAMSAATWSSRRVNRRGREAASSASMPAAVVGSKEERPRATARIARNNSRGAALRRRVPTAPWWAAS